MGNAGGRKFHVPASAISLFPFPFLLFLFSFRLYFLPTLNSVKKTTLDEVLDNVAVGVNLQFPCESGKWRWKEKERVYMEWGPLNLIQRVTVWFLLRRTKDWSPSINLVIKNKTSFRPQRLLETLFISLEGDFNNSAAFFFKHSGYNNSVNW